MSEVLELHAHVEGEGPDLLMLHGLFGSARNWLSLQRVLAKGHRVHALDLRNHGQSPWAEAMDYELMAADVAHYARQHCAGAPVVLGHSMGGKVAMAMALIDHDWLAGLIVVDIAPVENPPTLSSVLAAMMRVDPSRTSRRQEVSEWLAADVHDERTRAFLLQNLVTADGALRWRINLPAIERAMPGILGFPVTLAGARFDGPCQFIAGARSDYVQAVHEPVIRRLFPNARLATISDAGHWVHADQPQAFLATVGETLVQWG
ncbi:MAG: alpha/beta fold hydrolase [Burkholderiaceae bacterium]